MKPKALLTDTRFIMGVYILQVLVVSWFEYSSGTKDFWGLQVTHYNDFIIFRQSFFHLLHGQDLYALYPQEYGDHYIYSPTFAFFMAPFSHLPDLPGLILWNSLNSIPLFFAIVGLPYLDRKTKVLILWFIIPELNTTIQDEESNGIMAACLIMAFNFLERRNLLLASLLIVFTIYTKLFGAVAFSLAIFFPQRIKFIAYSILWVVIFFALPLAFINLHQLHQLYSNWYQLLKDNHESAYGDSAMGLLHSWLRMDIPKYVVEFCGAILFCIPMLRFKLYNEPWFRLLFLSSVLMWVVIFNHHAEPPSFILATTGAAIWFFMRKRTTTELIMICSLLLLTSLSSSDVFPIYVREHIIKAFQLKVLPCIVIWLRVVYELSFWERKNVSV